MDRLGQFSSPLLGSFSLPSLAEGSEAISEAEEINEVKALHDRGARAAKISDFEEALQFYNEALEIDSHDVKTLQARALVYLQQGNTHNALHDAESILGFDPNNSVGHLLQGVCYQHMGDHRAALTSMLVALDLEGSPVEKVTSHISSTVSQFCQISPSLSVTLKGMDSYEKLSKVGECLFHHKKYEECIDVLEAARKLQTNQKGITMRVLLTLANAHSQQMHIETAIGLYQECLAIAVATHEQAYQTKSLVNIATLHLENGDTHQAIIFYERLLHLEAELLSMAGSMGSPDAMPDYWTRELQCGLHLNLSIAYKTIGSMDSALAHARKYMALTQKFGLDARLVAESHHNAGMLSEILGNYQEALTEYKEYLVMSKNNSNRKGICQAYGCLASVYAALRNWSLSLSFHEQYIAMATKGKDRRMMSIAHEMMGDTLCLKENYEQAIEHYNHMLMLCRNRDNRGDATSRCKMAAAYRSLGQLQYSIYYYHEALSLAQRYGFMDIETLAEFHLACINKDSTQFTEREEAQKSFMRLIPFFERKIIEHAEENSHCPEEYEAKLAQCYDGMQSVLAVMSNKLGCLQYAEAHRKRCVIALPNFHATCRAGNHSLDFSREIWGTEHMRRIVSEQSATVLYYSLLDHFLLVWVLQPAEGVVRFYTAKLPPGGSSFGKVITDLLAEMREGWSKAELFNNSEPRSLPLKDAETQLLRSKNLRLCSPTAKDPEQREVQRKPALRRLFDLLVAPVVDILDKLTEEEETHLIIVPDKQLRDVPFDALLDYSNKPLSDKFNITYLPCLLLLDRVVQNELAAVSAEGDLDFEREQCRKGGLPKQISEHSDILAHHLSPTQSTPDFGSESVISKEPSLNLREVSNPRMASSRSLEHSVLKMLKTSGSCESTYLSIGGRAYRDAPPPTPVPESKPVTVEPPKLSTVNLGLPTCLEKMLSVHTYSTLTSRTWTGTDITASSQVVTQFQQISDPRTALVFGAPLISKPVMVHDKSWHPKSELGRAQQELIMVAECLGSNPVINADATRQTLLQRLEKAEVVHIATWSCLREGLLLVTPDPVDDQSDDSSHLVAVGDLLNMNMRAKLVVLSSCGLSTNRQGQESVYKLAACFLSAGCQCVLVSKWPVPDDLLCKFYFHFYQTLQHGALLTEALQAARQSINKDDRYNHVCHWAGFCLIGKDTKVNLNEIRHAHLDQLIDKVEAEVEEEADTPILNPRAVVPNAPYALGRTIANKEENLDVLMKHVKSLLRDHYRQPRVIVDLIDLLDSSLKRLHTMENNRTPSRLTGIIAGSGTAVALLKWLGFHFQAKEAQLSCPYIVFPHWNTDELLIPIYDSLKAALELSVCAPCVSALCDALPMTQDNISCLIDLMSITKHAPEIQLKTTDLSVHPLWHYTKTRALLRATGFHQVGLLLTFNMMSTQKQLLSSVLQLLLSISCHKSPILLYRLDVNLLGQASDTKSSVPEMQRLPSLTPLILPRNQLRMSTPWVSAVERREEMNEKMKLAKSTSNLSEEFNDYLGRARTWHQTTVVAQANETLDKYGRPQTMPKGQRPKVKVHCRLTPSWPSVPVNEPRSLNTLEVKQRRDYAHFIVEEREGDIMNRKKDSLLKLYLPYIKS